MSSKTPVPVRRGAAIVAGAALAATGVVVAPAAAVAAPDGSGLVISEVYGGGGNSGAPLTHDFVELFNPTDEAIDLADLSLEYKSSGGGSGGVLDLSGVVEPGAHFLVQLAAGSNGDVAALPTPDQTGSMNMSGSNGRVYLYEGSGQFPATEGDLAGAEGVVDMVGYGSAVSYEGTPAPGLSNSTSASRDAAGTDTDDNGADFTAGEPNPVNSAGETAGEPSEPDPEPEPEPVEPGEAVTIAEANQAATGAQVTIEGVVTADFREGGFNGFTIQDPAGDPSDGVSDAIFVYNPSGQNAPAVGDVVRVTGDRGEYNGLAQVYGDLIEPSDAELGEVQPITSWDAIATEEGKLAHMSELVQLDEPFTVTDNYDTNFYGSFVIAQGDDVLYQPTAYVDPHDAPAIDAFTAEQLARTLTVDDGRSMNFNSNANKGNPLTYLTPENPIRVGSAVSFAAPMVLDLRYDAWSLQPTEPIAFGDDGSDYVVVENDRAGLETAGEIVGDISIANFNVLNYFPTTGEEFEELTGISCSYYTDRDGNPIGTNRCGDAGPRGAANDESFARQQVKTVSAINELDASIVSLQELENSAAFGKDRDFAIANLVEALNEAAGEERWEYVESAAELPVDEDVIRNGFIYQPGEVELVGESYVLVGDEAFYNAREPLFQAFKAAGADDEDAFLVSNNHLKSKGSGTDDGTGQGNANPDRIAQAEGLIEFTAEVQELTGIEAVFQTGDFNAYAMEDPAMVIESAGYTNLNYALNGGEPTYVYDGFSASLDHVFTNEAALELVADVDVWQINGQEQVGFEYSRYNYNATLLYDESVFRTSDHNPIRVGLDVLQDEEPTEPGKPGENPGQGNGQGPGNGNGNGNGVGNGNGQGVGHGLNAAPAVEDLTVSKLLADAGTIIAAPGDEVRIPVGAAYAGQEVAGWMYSEPVSLGTAVVAADGSVVFAIPSDAPAGDHRIAVTDASGAVIGWVDVVIAEGGAAGLAATGGVPPFAAIAFMLLAAGASALVLRRRVA